MKKLLTLLVLIISLPTIYSFGQNVGINDDASTPNAPAMLDVKSTTRGVLLPRVVLTSTTSASPVISPTAGLVVFNTATAGDVTPGYYYWDGSSSWVRFSSGGSVGNVVSKTATGSLLKTDAFVLASNSITLTLPAITAADNGLAITVKNAGAVVDLITVAGNGAATIDGILSLPATLTRWKSRTFIANGSNWFVKEKEYRRDNEYDVSSRSSFTTIAEVISFLNAHSPVVPSVIILCGGTYTVSSTIAMNFAEPITIMGESYGETEINFTGSTGPIFNCTTECYFKMIDFTTNTAAIDGIVLNSGAYHEIKDCTFDQGTQTFARAINITGNDQLWLFDATVSNCTVAGVQVNYTGAATGTMLEISETDFENDAIGLYLLAAKTPVVNITNTTFYNGSGQTGLLYTPATFSPFTSIFITNNSWNNVGTFISGFVFDGTETPVGRDSKAFIENNAGMESKRPLCKVEALNSVATTTISPANAWTKANWTNSSTHTCKWTISTGIGNGNRITYQPVNVRDVIVNISGNLSVNGGGRVINFGFCKNGVTTTRYGEETMYCSSSAQMYQFSTVAYLSDVTPNDYFEFFVTSSVNNDIIIVSDVNLFANSQ
jgi:hypothetical protein